MVKKALITGITGQDGSYLADYLVGLGYQVYGLVRRTSIDSEQRMYRIAHLMANSSYLHILPGSLESYSSVCNAVMESKPDEVYHLGAQSFVKVSWEDIGSTMNINVNGTVNVLEAVRHFKKDAKVYLACSSEMFGNVLETPQRETTPFNPRSPYGISKCTEFYLGKNYRESYNMFVANGILFNHESERRGLEFVTRKITHGLARVKAGLQECVTLGNLDAKRDWGHARDYVVAMWKMLQHDVPDDFVIATGETHTVREFASLACQFLKLPFEKVIRVSEEFMRPADVNLLLGDSMKARTQLGWSPTISFTKLVRDMTYYDLRQVGVDEVEYDTQ